EIPLKVVYEPHRVHVEVRDDNSLASVEPVLGLEPGDYFRRQEMSAYGDIWPVFFQKSNKRPGVELIKSKPATLVFPGLVHLIVEPPKEIRVFVHHIDVGPGIKVPEYLGRVFEGVDVTNFASRAHLSDGAFDRLSCPDMTSAR